MYAEHKCGSYSFDDGRSQVVDGVPLVEVIFENALAHEEKINKTLIQGNEFKNDLPLKKSVSRYISISKDLMGVGTSSVIGLIKFISLIMHHFYLYYPL